MIQYLLIAGLVLFLLCKNNDITEGITMDCCGGIRLDRNDYSETDRNPPGEIVKCFKDPSEWNSFPCTSKDNRICCGGEGKCIPTRQGGMCEKRLGNNKTEYHQYNYGRKYRMSGRDLRNADEIDLNRRSNRERVLERRSDSERLGSLYRPVQFDDSLDSSTSMIILVSIIAMACSIIGAFMFYYK